MTVFAHYAQYYDLLYRDKDYATEARFVATLLRRHAPTATSLIELGCGTGLHAALLATEGYALTGIDSSADMVRLAEDRRSALPHDLAGRVRFTHSDIRGYEATQKHDAAISLFHVMSYQASNDDLLNALATVKRSVRAGGILLFDGWYGPAVLQQRPEVRIKRLESENLRIVRLAEPQSDPNANCVDVCYHIIATDVQRKETSEVREVHRMRYFFVPELELLMKMAGLTLEWHGEWLTERTLGFDTWNACFVARVL